MLIYIILSKLWLTIDVCSMTCARPAFNKKNTYYNETMFDTYSTAIDVHLS